MITFTPKNKKSVVVGYIHHGIIQNEFMLSLLNMISYDQTHEQYYRVLMHCGGLYLADNRNKLVKLFLESNAEWLLFVDTDMGFPETTLQQMVEVADPDTRPIVGALYFNYLGQKQTITPVWMVQNEHSDYMLPTQIDESILTPLTVAGTGGLIVHRSVFEKLKVIHENDPWTWFGHDVATIIAGEPPIHLGEDLTFCVRARAAGYPIYGYAGLIMHHKKTKVVGVEDYLFQNIFEQVNKS